MCDAKCEKHGVQCFGNLTYDTGAHAAIHHHQYFEEVSMQGFASNSVLRICSWTELNGVQSIFVLGNHACDWVIYDPATLLKATRKSAAGEPDKITVLCKLCQRSIDYVPVWDVTTALDKEYRRTAGGFPPE